MAISVDMVIITTNSSGSENPAYKLNKSLFRLLAIIIPWVFSVFTVVTYAHNNYIFVLRYIKILNSCYRVKKNIDKKTIFP